MLIASLAVSGNLSSMRLLIAGAMKAVSGACFEIVFLQDVPNSELKQGSRLASKAFIAGILRPSAL